VEICITTHIHAAFVELQIVHVPCSCFFSAGNRLILVTLGHRKHPRFDREWCRVDESSAIDNVDDTVLYK
jgi:hypothetical protein